MDIYYSDLCLLGGKPEDNLKALLELGADRVELMMDGGAWNRFERRQEELLSALGGAGAACSLHAPCWDLNLTSESGHIRDASLKSALDAIEFAARMRCSHLVIHPGLCQAGVFDKARAKERARNALVRLAGEAERRGVRIAVENVGYHGTSLYEYGEYVTLLEGFGPHVGYILDVGHALLNGWDPAAAVRDTAERLMVLHLHDNDGSSDSHLPLGEGAVDWDSLFGEIAALTHPCSLVLEYNFGVPLEALPRAKERIERRFSKREGQGR